MKLLNELQAAKAAAEQTRPISEPADEMKIFCIIGIWSSLSGAGRFVSRAGTDTLVDHINPYGFSHFQFTAVVVFSVQIIVVSDLF